MNKSTIAAIIVTYNRKHLLQRCLQKLYNQSLKPSSVFIIDNASTDGTVNFLEENNWLSLENITLRSLSENLGGAGGFYAGIDAALQTSSEWLWLMDDDGYPETRSLELLLDYAHKNNLDAISPVHIDIENPLSLAFPLWVNKKLRALHFSNISEIKFIPYEANLFNGLLIHRRAIEKIGLPRKEFFIRGDEVEYTKRMKKNSIRYGTLCSSIFFHPSDKNERIPMFFGLISTRDANSDFKNYYMFRNRAVAFIEDGNAWLLPLDFIRYCYYFLVFKKGQFSKLHLWFKATLDGIQGKLGRHPKY